MNNALISKYNKMQYKYKYKSKAKNFVEICLNTLYNNK